MKTVLAFSTTGAWDMVEGFGCASLGLAGVCNNNQTVVVNYPCKLEGITLCGSYRNVLADAKKIRKTIHAAIVLFGNAGGENGFMEELQKVIQCPMVGGGAAIDTATGRGALITGGGEVAVFLITDDRYTYKAVTQCIHDHVLGQVNLTLGDSRTIMYINNIPAEQYLAEKRAELGLKDTDFEHLTLSDMNNINAHLSCTDGIIKSGRDLQETMLLRYVDHNDVYDRIRAFYDDDSAIVFGCAGLSGLLDNPLDTKSLGLFLFGEVCTVDGYVQFGNLMLSKLVIEEK